MVCNLSSDVNELFIFNGAFLKNYYLFYIKAPHCGFALGSVGC